MNVPEDSRPRWFRWRWGLVAALAGVCLAVGVWLTRGRVVRSQGGVAEEIKALPDRVVIRPMQGWSVAYSPVGELIAVGVGRPSARGELQLWDAASGQLRARSKERRGVASVAFSPDGDLVAGCNWENLVKIYRTETLDVTVTIDLESRARLAFSPDGKTLATATGRGDRAAETGANVRLWEVATGNEAFSCEGELLHISCLAFSPDGKLVVAGGTVVEHRVAPSPDGKPVIEGNLSVEVNAEEGRVISSADGKPAAEQDVTVPRIAMVGRVICWDVATREKAHVLDAQGGTVAALAFSPDGATMATGGMDKMVRLWEISSGEVKKTLEGHEDWVVSIAFSPDGTMLATGSTDHTARLWDIQSGEPLASVVADTESVRSLAFSPDGGRLVTIGREGSPKLWDITTLREAGTLGPVRVLTESESDLAEAGRARAVRMKARLTLDFPEQFKLEDSRLMTGDGLDQYCKPEPEGLRVTIPENSDPDYSIYDSKIVVRGDFELTAAFTILDIPRPEKGYGAGPRIAILDSRGERAAVQRVHRHHEGQVFIAYNSPILKDGTREHISESIATEGNSGWLRLKREGTTLRYLAAQAGSDHFTQFYESEFPNDVAKIRLITQTGGSPTPVDVLWINLDIRAEHLDDGSEQ